MSGFGGMTLNPAPRLSSMRSRLQQRNFCMEARELISQAMTEEIAHHAQCSQRRDAGP
jgi:hypothetical protein